MYNFSGNTNLLKCGGGKERGVMLTCNSFPQCIFE